MSSPSDDASKAANAQEAQRQANIAQGTAQVNKVFDDPARKAAYDQLAKDTTAYYTQQLDQQKAQNDRGLKFALARSGQTGGSVATDQAEQAGKDYTQGVLNATRMGQQAGANLQAQDVQEKTSLLSAVQAGLDANTAAEQSSAALSSNIANAKANSTNTALGNTFGDFANLYQKSLDDKNQRQGFLYAYNTVYQPGFGAGAGGKI